MKLRRLGIGLGFMAAVGFAGTGFAQDSGDGGSGQGDEGSHDDHGDHDDEPPHCQDESECMDGHKCVYPQDLGFEEDPDGREESDSYDDGDDYDGGDEPIDDHEEDDFGSHGYCVPSCEVDEDCRQGDLCHVDVGACVPGDVIDDLEEEGLYDHEEAVAEREADLDDAGGLLGGCGGASAVPPSLLMLFGSLGTLWVRRRFR